MDFDSLDICKTKNVLIKIDFQAPMYYANVVPEPDEKTISTISYTMPEKLEEIYRKGVYVYAESLSNKKGFENKNFILATIIGGLISLLAGDLLNMLRKDKREE